MIHAKFQPNMPSCTGGKVDFIGSAIFSTGDHHGLDSRPGPEVIKLIFLLNSILNDVVT